MLYLEVGPLTELEYTGIPQVTVNLAEQMLGDTENDVGFFVGRQQVDSKLVDSLVRRRSGEMFNWHLRRANTPLVPLQSTAPSTAIFPNSKTARRVFEFEVQIFHDLSTLLTPQFHNQDRSIFNADNAGRSSDQ